jgi:prevent-host-death family protein
VGQELPVKPVEDLDNMTINSHNIVMKVNISELKAKLSAYVDAVRRGETVIVLDRKTPVAQLAPLAGEADDLCIAQATRPPREISTLPGVRPKCGVDVVKVLGESRGNP